MEILIQISVLVNGFCFNTTRSTASYCPLSSVISICYIVFTRSRCHPQQWQSRCHSDQNTPIFLKNNKQAKYHYNSYKSNCTVFLQQYSTVRAMAQLHYAVPVISNQSCVIHITQSGFLHLLVIIRRNLSLNMDFCLTFSCFYWTKSPVLSVPWSISIYPQGHWCNTMTSAINQKGTAISSKGTLMDCWC